MMGNLSFYLKDMYRWCPSMVLLAATGQIRSYQNIECGVAEEEGDDKAVIKSSPIVRISAIHVWSAELVDAIQVEYLRTGGNFLLGNKRGEGNFCCGGRTGGSNWRQIQCIITPYRS